MKYKNTKIKLSTRKIPRKRARVIRMTPPDEAMKNEKKERTGRHFNVHFSPEQKQTLRDMVVRIMAERHLTQAEFGELVGVTQVTVGAWIGKTRGITRTSGEAICALEGTTLEMLFGSGASDPELDAVLKEWSRGKYAPLVEDAAEAVLRDRSKQGFRYTREEWNVLLVRVCDVLRAQHAHLRM